MAGRGCLATATSDFLKKILEDYPTPNYWNNTVGLEKASKSDPTAHIFYFLCWLWLKLWLSRGFVEKIWVKKESRFISLCVHDYELGCSPSLENVCEMASMFRINALHCDLRKRKGAPVLNCAPQLFSIGVKRLIETSISNSI
jgi:hypothetical protein